MEKIIISNLQVNLEDLSEVINYLKNNNKIIINDLNISNVKNNKLNLINIQDNHNNCNDRHLNLETINEIYDWLKFNVKRDSGNYGLAIQFINEGEIDKFFEICRYYYYFDDDFRNVFKSLPDMDKGYAKTYWYTGKLQESYMIFDNTLSGPCKICNVTGDLLQNKYFVRGLEVPKELRHPDMK